tara:strand:+ start:60 stop:227 length:168 start_codon:yes stop_codon:yes gene_type:complete
MKFPPFIFKVTEKFSDAYYLNIIGRFIEIAKIGTITPEEAMQQILAVIDESKLSK